MKVVLVSLLVLLSCSSAALAQAEISVTGGMQSCMKHADCGLVATSCLQACSHTPVNKAAMSNLNARYRDYCGFEASSRPACNITPPLQATCVKNRCTLVQATSMGGGQSVPQHKRAATAPMKAAPTKMAPTVTSVSSVPPESYAAMRKAAAEAYGISTTARTTAPRRRVSSSDKSGYFTAYDLPQNLVRQNIMGQYQFEQPQNIQPAAGN